MQSKVLVIQNAVTQLERQIQTSSLSLEMKGQALANVRMVDIQLLAELSLRASTTLTRNNLMYILCFLAGLPTKSIAAIFHVEPSTVLTARYRLRSRFEKTGILNF